MFLDAHIRGIDLPPKTLCLTYDDGPGPRTLELGHYLYQHQIPAAFFVVGQHAEPEPGLLRQLRRWGHIVGNHTYSHPGLVALAERGEDIVGELQSTDDIICAAGAASEPMFFRPPYGNWLQLRADKTEESTSIVARRLNDSGLFSNYVGPINWDISAADFAFWRRGESADLCARAYLAEIERVGRGIVLLHDSSDEEIIRRNNQTLELTRILVPELKARGYRFVGLDELPQVQLALNVGVPALAGMLPG